jgi:hypothetical protein
VSIRNERIDEALASAAELIGRLLELGPLNADQAGVIVDGNVRAVVPNAQQWEIVARAKMVAADAAEALTVPKIKIMKRKPGKQT